MEVERQPDKHRTDRSWVLRGSVGAPSRQLANNWGERYPDFMNALILELGDKVRRELGDKFSLKEFHNVALRTGTVPLEVLEEVVDEYIATKKQP